MVHANGAATHHASAERVDAIEAGGAEIDRSAVRTLTADHAELSRSAVQQLNASNAEVVQSAIGVARFERGTVKQSMVGAVVGRGIACDEVRTGILAAPVVRGEVHTWLDLRTAVAIGVGIALGQAVLSLLGWVVKRPFR